MDTKSNSFHTKSIKPQQLNDFLKLIESAGDGILLGDSLGNVIWCNKKLCDITGLSLQEIEGRNISHFFHKDELAKNPLRFDIVNQGKAVLVERDILKKNGETIPVEMHSSKTDGGYISLIRDISVRKKIEAENTGYIKSIKKKHEKLEVSENKFRQYIEQNTAPMLSVDVKTKKIIFANQSASKLYGYTIEELLQLTVYDINILSREEINKKMASTVKSSSNRFIFKHRRKNKEIIEVDVNASSVITDNQYNIVLIITDLTKEINIKRELQISHDTYRNILNSISEMVYVQNEKGEFLFVNETVKKQYGYNKAEFIGRTPEFLSAPNKNNLAEIVEKVKNAFNGNSEVFEFWGLTKNKKIFPKEVILSPGYFFGEKVVIAVSRNISAHKKIMTELVTAKDKAEENDKLKSAFLANMSHEIRTPMNAILGFSGLIQDQDIPNDERNHFLNIINKSSNHLVNLINDIVDISKIQANQMKYVPRTINLNSLLNELEEFFNADLVSRNKKGIVKLIFKKGFANGKDTIHTDATRLRQILHNIIANSIKFTEQGNIIVSYELKFNFIEFSIIDEGIGVPLEKQESIFERFNQADTMISRDYGGTGLGLSISKACTELLGGEIWCDKNVEKGTKIIFTIPYSKADN